MILNRYTKSLLLLFCCLIFGGSLQADDGIFQKRIPLPYTELESILSDWLGRTGYAVQQSSEMNQVLINGTKEEERWEIFLKQDSPLATLVKVRYTVHQRPDPSGIDRLWSFVEGYLKGPSSEGEGSNQIIPNVVLRQIPSVVCVKAAKGDQVYQTSGFVVDKEGLLVCTAHSLQKFQAISIRFHDGRECKGEVSKIDFQRDLALVNVKLKSDTFISLSDGRRLLGMGEKIFSVGCPNNLAGTVESGIVNSPPKRVNDVLLWQANMKIYPGSSGSPVFDVQGNLVAVVKGRYRGTESIGFLIALDTLLAFIREN